jgi:hypothetical protein
VLNISIGPVAFRTGIIAPVEKRIECFENERLILLRRCTSHGAAFRFSRCVKLAARGFGPKVVYESFSDMTLQDRYHAGATPCCVEKTGEP